MDIDQPGVRRVAIPPDLLKQDLSREHLARFAGKAGKQVEFQRRQQQALSIALDRVAIDVDLEIADHKTCRGRVVETTDTSTDARNEFLGLERLDDVVVGT